MTSLDFSIAEDEKMRELVAFLDQYGQDFWNKRLSEHVAKIKARYADMQKAAMSDHNKKRSLGVPYAERLKVLQSVELYEKLKMEMDKYKKPKPITKSINDFRMEQCKRIGFDTFISINYFDLYE